MALNAQILLSILAHESSSGDISQTLRATPASYSLTLGNGTGANQAQVVWSDAGALSSNVPISLNSLSDDRGTVAFSSIKLLFLRNTGAADVVVSTDSLGEPENWSGGPVKGGAPDAVTVPPGGVWIATNPSASGWAVGSADDYAIGLSADAATSYEIILIGEGTVT